jgi:hypothetical protein
MAQKLAGRVEPPKQRSSFLSPLIEKLMKK